MSESSASIRHELVAEIIGLLKRIFDARNQTRARVFAREVAPVMEKMRASHSDFIEILGKLQQIIDEALRLAKSQKNDVRPEVHGMLDRLRSLSELRDARRLERREMYEESAWWTSTLAAGSNLQNLVISADEAKTMNRFFGLVTEYFRSENGSYGHDIQKFITEGYRLLHSHESAHSDLSTVEAGLKTLRQRARSYEHECEEAWGTIAREFAALRHRLEPG